MIHYDPTAGLGTDHPFLNFSGEPLSELLDHFIKARTDGEIFLARMAQTI